MRSSCDGGISALLIREGLVSTYLSAHLGGTRRLMIINDISLSLPVIGHRDFYSGMMDISDLNSPTWKKT